MQQSYNASLMNGKKISLCTVLLVMLSCSQGDIDLHDTRSISSESLKGHWVIVNYWADWCPPCLKEIPELAKFSNLNPDIKVFGFNFDRLEGEELEEQLDRFGHTYPSLLTHPKTIWGIETPQSLPATFFINPNGEVVFASKRPIDATAIGEILSSLQ